MLSLIRHESFDEPVDQAEPVSRLASVRHALRLVDAGFSDGPSDELEQAISNAWPKAGSARQRCFDRQSSRLVAQTAAGIEALLGARHGGHAPHAEASQTLVNQIRRELHDLAGIIVA